MQEATQQSASGSTFSIPQISHSNIRILLIHHRDPEDNSKSKDRLDYWLWLARLAEKGKITSVFIADSYAGHNIYGGSADASYKGGSHIGKLDPLMIVPAMAAVTESVSFGITASTSYILKSLPLLKESWRR